jgi:hypothetical protein
MHLLLLPPPFFLATSAIHLHAPVPHRLRKIFLIPGFDFSGPAEARNYGQRVG